MDMNGTKVEPPLKINAATRIGPLAGGGQTVAFDFNRPPTDAELDQLCSLPPATKIARDLADMVKRAMTFEIVARLCREYVLSGVMRSEGPEVTKWLLRYIDGDGDLGPLGAPLPWPDGLLETGAMLQSWGFERSPNGWVARAGTHRSPVGVKPS